MHARSTKISTVPVGEMENRIKNNIGFVRRSDFDLLDAFPTN